MKKAVSLMVLFVLSVLVVSTAVSALDNSNLVVKSVEINGNDVDDGETIAVDEGETLHIEVGLKAASGADDIEIDAKIAGLEHAAEDGKLTTATELFDIQAGNTKYADLTLELPTRLEKTEYTLRLRVLQKDGASIEKTIQLEVEPKRHGLDIADVTVSPGTTIKAGRSLLATVLLENFGDKDEKDVKVTVAIPTLGVSATEFVDVVKTDNHNVEFEDVPEMFLPVPATAAAGEYEVVVTVSYDHYFETVSKSFKVNVVENEMFQTSDKLVLAVGPENQAVAAGSKATYGVALTNAGKTSKAFTVNAVTGDWATATVSESLVVLEPGKNKVVYVDVQANANAPEGEQVVSVSVNSGAEVLETVTLKATVVAGQESGSSVSLRNGLEIALIVLVVLLVIIGLIIGFSRLRKDDEDEEQTYY